jgi:hypothetical protein
MIKRAKKMRVCECGYAVADGNYHQHRFSVFHRQHRKIKALLSNTSLSFAHIGKKFGITRERVRQIARQLGSVSGRERRQQRRLAGQIAAWKERRGYRELIAKCEKLRYTVAPSRRDTRWGWRFEHDVVLINGWRSHIVYMRNKGRYLAFTRSDAPANFHVGISPIGFFIFPTNVWRTFPPKTAFAPIPCRSGPGFTRSCRHDYLDYLEAWKLLKARKRQ